MVLFMNKYVKHFLDCSKKSKCQLSRLILEYTRKIKFSDIQDIFDKVLENHKELDDK